MIIQVINLFQADNRFDTNASLTYGPQIQQIPHVFDNCKPIEIINSIYRAGEFSLH